MIKYFHRFFFLPPKREKFSHGIPSLRVILKNYVNLRIVRIFFSICNTFKFLVSTQPLMHIFYEQTCGNSAKPSNWINFDETRRMFSAHYLWQMRRSLKGG